MAFDGAAGYKADGFDDRIPRCLDIVAARAPRRMLDLGCGDGFFMDLAMARGCGRDVMAGVEISKAAAEIVRSKGYRCAAQSVEEAFPFPDDAFDLVFAGEVLEHVRDTDALLSEAYRVLAPGGRLLLTTPNLAAWFNRILLLFGITPMFVEHSYRATYGPAYTLFGRVGQPVGHLRIFTWAPLLAVLRQNHFEIEMKCASACLPFAGFHTLDKLISRTLPNLGANLIALARKPA